MQSPFDDVLARADALASKVRETRVRELRRAVASFCAAHVDAARIDREAAIGPELLARIAEQGWFGLTVPEAHGGLGLGLRDATEVIAELASHDGSVATSVGLHAGLGLHAILHAAPDGLRARVLPEAARGERIASFAATEPGAGSDVAGVRTTLAEVDGALRLSGSKCFVTNGGFCGMVTVLARSPGLGGARAGHTLVLVDPSAPGVRRGREEHKLGLRGSSTITIDFDDVEIPRDHVLGSLGDGLSRAHSALEWGRTFLASGCVGTARAALAQARSHVTGRVQFGRTLASFPLVRAQLAEAAADLHAAESVLRLVTELHDMGAPIAIPSAIAKVLASETAYRVADVALQLHGGSGYIEEVGIARRLRDLRVPRIFEGANDVLRLHVGSSILGWDRSAPGAAPNTLGRATGDDAHRALDAAGAARARIEEVRTKMGLRLASQQLLQTRIADAIVSAYAVLAVLLRPTDAPIARLALRRLDERLRSLPIEATSSGDDARLIDAAFEAV